MRSWSLGTVVILVSLFAACSGGDPAPTTSGVASSSSASSSGGGQGGSVGVLTCDDQALPCDGAQGCQACAREAACKPQLDACTANAECMELNNCFGMCAALPSAEQPACKTQCRTDHTNGEADYDAISACVICEQCSKSCPDISVDCPP